MGWFGKLTFGSLGLFLGGPLGAIAGAVEREAGLAVRNRVSQSTDTVDDTGLAVAHRQHLADAAGLETRWHQEQVSGRVHRVRQHFRIAFEKQYVSVTLRHGEQAILVVLLTAAQDNDGGRATEGRGDAVERRLAISRIVQQ